MDTTPSFSSPSRALRSVPLEMPRCSHNALSAGSRSPTPYDPSAIIDMISRIAWFDSDCFCTEGSNKLVYYLYQFLRKGQENFSDLANIADDLLEGLGIAGDLKQAYICR